MSYNPHCYNTDVLEKIAFPTKEGFVFVSKPMINYCQADDKYTHICMLDKSDHLIIRSLEKVMEIINASTFVRIHRSYVVNANQCANYLAATNELIMENGAVVHVSRDHCKTFKEFFIHDDKNKTG